MSVPESISLVLDIILIILGILTYVRRPKLGGLFSRGMRILILGMIVLGFTHMIETGLFIIFQFDEEWNEVIHRVLVVAAFGFVLLGLNRMQSALDQ